MTTGTYKAEYLDLDDVDLESDYLVFSRYELCRAKPRLTEMVFGNSLLPGKSIIQSRPSESLRDNLGNTSCYRTASNHAGGKIKNTVQRIFRTKTNSSVTLDKFKRKTETQTNHLSTSKLISDSRKHQNCVEEFIWDEKEIDRIVTERLLYQNNNNIPSVSSSSEFSNKLSNSYTNMIDVVKDKEISRDIPLISPCVDIKSSGIRLNGSSALQEKCLKAVYTSEHKNGIDSKLSSKPIELNDKDILNTTTRRSFILSSKPAPPVPHIAKSVSDVKPRHQCLEPFAKSNKDKIEAENSQRLDNLIFSKFSSNSNPTPKEEIKMTPSRPPYILSPRMINFPKDNSITLTKTEFNKKSPWNLSSQESNTILDFTEKADKEGKEIIEDEPNNSIEVLDIETIEPIINPSTQINVISKHSEPSIKVQPEEGIATINIDNDHRMDTDYKDNVVFEITKRGNILALQEKIKDFDSKQMHLLKDRHGNNLVHISAIFGHMNCLKFVASKFGDVIIEENKSGLTPAACAIKYGNLCCLQWLAVETQAWEQLNPSDGKRSLLHYAAKYSQSDILSWLIHYMQDSRIDLNPADIYGNTPAHLAAKYGNLKCLQILSESGANMILDNKFGHTPCFCADYNGHVECVKYLLAIETAMMLCNDVLKLEKEKEKEFEENDRLTSYLNQVIGISQRLINQVEGQLSNMCEVLQEINQDLVTQLEDAYRENCNLRQMVNGGIKNGYKGELMLEMRSRCQRLRKLYKEMKDRLITPSKEEAEHIKCIQHHVTQRLTAMRNPGLSPVNKTQLQLFREIMQSLATKIRAETLKAKDDSLCNEPAQQSLDDIKLPDSESVEESVTSLRASYCSSERQTTGHASEKSFDSLAISEVSSLQKFTNSSSSVEKSGTQTPEHCNRTVDLMSVKDNYNKKENLPDLTQPMLRKIHPSNTSTTNATVKPIEDSKVISFTTISEKRNDNDNIDKKALLKETSAWNPMPFNRYFGTRSLSSSNKFAPSSNSKSTIQTAPSNYIFLHMYEGRKSLQEKHLTNEDNAKKISSAGALGMKIPCSDHTPPMTKIEYFIDKDKELLETNEKMLKGHVKPIIMDKSSAKSTPIVMNHSAASKKILSDIFPNERRSMPFRSLFSSARTITPPEKAQNIITLPQEKLTGSAFDLTKTNMEFSNDINSFPRRSILKSKPLARSESDLSARSSEFGKIETVDVNSELKSKIPSQDAEFSNDTSNGKLAKHRLHLKKGKRRGGIEMSHGDFHDTYERPFSRADSSKSQSSSFSSYDSEIRSNANDSISSSSGCHEFVRQPVVYRKVHKSLSAEVIKNPWPSESLSHVKATDLTSTDTNGTYRKLEFTRQYSFGKSETSQNHIMNYEEELPPSIDELDLETVTPEQPRSKSDAKPWYEVSDDDTDSLPRRRPRGGSSSDE